jgi:S1 RNA binding domain protein
MEFAVGAILEGKVTGITKFGAFVALPGNKTGMVHISEIAHAYVSDISEYLTVGQEVKVKVIALDPAGKINLSIKKTVEPPPRQGRSDRPQRSGDRGEREGRGDRPQRSGNRGSYEQRQRPAARTSAPKEPQSFDDMLKQFMADSDSKISSIKQYSDHRTKRGRRQ